MQARPVFSRDYANGQAFIHYALSFVGCCIAAEHPPIFQLIDPIHFEFFDQLFGLVTCVNRDQLPSVAGYFLLEKKLRDELFCFSAVAFIFRFRWLDI